MRGHTTRPNRWDGVFTPMVVISETATYDSLRWRLPLIGYLLSVGRSASVRPAARVVVHDGRLPEGACLLLLLLLLHGACCC